MKKFKLLPIFRTNNLTNVFRNDANNRGKFELLKFDRPRLVKRELAKPNQQVETRTSKFDHK